MNDCMTFPNTVEEFMEKYKVVDTDQVYSNGMEFVPIFRMKQWFEHLQDAQPDLCDGCDRYGASCVGEGCGKLEPEIIRCCDCISYQEGIDIDGKPFTRCNGSVRTYGHTLPDWFCADAERRTDGTEQP